MRLYRLLTGPDDSAFCKRVTEALNQGWALHGSPAITYNGTTAIVAQAVIKEVEGTWDPALTLSEL